MRVTGIRHTGLVVRDMPKMIEFYLGLGFRKITYVNTEKGKYLSESMGLEGARALVVKLETPDHSILELLEMESHPEENRRHIAFEVDDLKNGARSPYHHVKTKWIQDPEGNWIECVELI